MPICSQSFMRLEAAVADVETAVTGGDVLVDVAFYHFRNPASCFGAINLSITTIFPGKSSFDRIDQTPEDFHRLISFLPIYPAENI